MKNGKRPLFSFEDEEREERFPLPGGGGEDEALPSQNVASGRAEAVEEDEEPVRAVAVVDVDIPLSRLALLFLKILVVLVPFLVVLGVALHFVWQIATFGNA